MIRSGAAQGADGYVLSQTRAAAESMSLLIGSGFVSVRSCKLTPSTLSVLLLDILVPNGVFPNTLNGLTSATCATSCPTSAIAGSPTCPR